MQLAWDNANARERKKLLQNNHILECPAESIVWTHAGCSLRGQYIYKLCSLVILGHRCTNKDPRPTYDGRFLCQTHSNPKNDVRDLLYVKANSEGKGARAVRFISSGREVISLDDRRLTKSSTVLKGRMCVDCGSNTIVKDRPTTVGVDGAAASYFCRKHDLYTVRCEHGHTALSYQICKRSTRSAATKSALRDCYLGCHVAQNEDSAAAGEGPSESSYSDAADVEELISRFTNWKGGRTPAANPMCPQLSWRMAARQLLTCSSLSQPETNVGRIQALTAQRALVNNHGNSTM
jgi:hypothetical protein